MLSVSLNGWPRWACGLRPASILGVPLRTNAGSCRLSWGRDESPTLPRRAAYLMQDVTCELAERRQSTYTIPWHISAGGYF